MAKKQDTQKDTVEVKNITNHVVHVGNKLILPRETASVDKPTAERLERKGLVQILNGGK